MANAPDRFALFILGPDEKRVEIQEDAHLANAATFVLNKEDHTLGNLLRHAVLAVPGVIFCGYRVPHPLEPRTVIKVQTDGSLTPVQALKAGCERVISQVGSVRSSWKHECQMLGAGLASAGANGGQYAFGSFGEQRGGADVGGYVDI
ncbi:RBP11-like subunits of RNA polymerase, partial [Acaromyces ingoldii]